MTRGYAPKYKMGADGLFHCPECKFSHKRGSAVGRHRLVHRPGGYYHPGKTSAHKNTGMVRGPYNTKSKLAKENKNAQIVKQEVHAHQERDGHGQESVVYFLLGRITEIISGAAPASGCTPGELAERLAELLHPVSGRKVRRA